MSKPLVIRRAGPADLDAIGRITLDAYLADGFLQPGDDYAAQLVDAEHRVADAEVWVAAVGESVVGSVTFCPPGSEYRELARNGEGEFRMLAVSPAVRGQGIGRALVVQCLERSREVGQTEMVICSMTSMTKAHSLYTSMGFSRDESLDWEPVPGVLLWGFRLRL